MLSWMEILHSLTKIAALCTGGTERKQHLCVFAGIRKRTRIMKEQSCLLWQQTIDVAQWARHGASPTITRVLRACAARFLKADMADEVLKLYTPQSLRIGACVLLYEKGKSAVFIKDRLHWKSDTFMDYLRDTTIVARQHAAALVRA